MVAAVILTLKYEKAYKAKDENQMKNVYEFYISNLEGINNWDLVDVSAHRVIGRYLLDKPRDILYEFAQSDRLRTRRVAILSTMWFVKLGETKETYKMAEVLVNDTEDLMHKAVGWLLREAGKKDMPGLEKFLDKHAATMPRTMLRYSLEKFEKERREYYMKLGK